MVDTTNDEVKLYSSGILASSAEIMNNKILQSGSYDSMFVSSGGTVNETTVQSGGIMRISSGGVANDTVITPGGIAHVSEGGMASGTVINGESYSFNGGLFVYSGAVVSDTQIHGYGHLYLASGGVAVNTCVTGRKYPANMEIYGLARNTTICSGGAVNILNGGVTSESTVGQNGTLAVNSGGVADYTEITYGGSVTVLESGTANNATVNEGGCLKISGGGTANDATVNSGGTLRVYSGGTATNVEWTPCVGKIFAEDGAIVTYASQYSGCYYGSNDQLLSSSAEMSSKVIGCGCSMYVMQGGTANDATVNAGGSFCVSSGTANNATVNEGGIMHVAKGTAQEIKENGGYVSYDSGANVTFAANEITDLDLYSSATLHSGTTATNTMVNAWSKLYVYDGGKATDTIVDADGNLTVYSGGTINGTTISGGKVEIKSRGLANGTTIEDGFMAVECNGSADEVSIQAGTLNIASGGTATNIQWTPCVGSVYIADGATATFANQHTGCYYGSENMLLSAAEVLTDKVVNSGFVAYAMEGGTASNTTLSDGGEFFIWSGGTAKDTQISSDACLCASSGGTADRTTIGTYGELRVSQGGIAKNTTVCSDGELRVLSGGTLSGSLQMESYSFVSVEEGATIDFTVAEQTAPETALIQDISAIIGSNKANYTITVNADQTDGTYVLAAGAADFSGTVTVQNTLGTTLDTLAVGETKKINDVNYTLAKTEDDLTLTIDAAVVKSAKSDLDGNGISDVMFQYTGGNYQIGFWMNGTATWQGTGAPQPAEWELLGNYDMDANGNADQVMFGNVTDGTYVGYYKDGDTTSNGWVNIGFLSNQSGIKWDKTVGNLTGNDDKNSIVWHAAECGAAGVWIDGTNDWVGISGYFDDAWELQGCGDFNGDGKDEILWKCNGELYTTDIDSNFASLGNASGLEVRAIGDFSNDGIDDIILFHEETGVIMIYEDGKASQWSSLGQLDANDWFICGAGDYNNDGEDDLLVRQYSTGMLGYYTSGDMSQWNGLGNGVDMNWTVIA